MEGNKMRRNELTKNWTLKDDVNSRAAISLQDLDKGTELSVVACAKVITDESDDGEEKKVTCFRTEDGQYYSTVSSMIYSLAENIMSFIDDEEKAIIRVDSRKSKGGRDFLTVTIL